MKTLLVMGILIFGISEVANCQTKETLLTEKEKIEALIKSIENLESAKFYRNGSIYDAETAGKHLRMKLNKAGDRVKTVEDFIEKIGSKSSITDENYKIIYADGKEIIARTYFYNVLKSLK